MIITAKNTFSSPPQINITKVDLVDKREVKKHLTDSYVSNTTSHREDYTSLVEIAKRSPETRNEIVREIEAKIATNDYPLESSLSEALRKLIQAKVLKG